MHWALSCGEKGFTLAEFAIVVLLLGITAMTVIPQWHSMASEAKLNGAAGEVILALEYARNLAVKHQRPFQVKAYTTAFGDGKANQFLVTDNRYASDANAHGDAEPPVYTWGRVYHPLNKRSYIIDFDGPQEALVGVITPGTEYDGVIITSVPGGHQWGPPFLSGWSLRRPGRFGQHHRIELRRHRADHRRRRHHWADYCPVKRGGLTITLGGNPTRLFLQNGATRKRS